MWNKKQGRKLNSRGYSLIELIIAMLVTSIVMLAVISFVTTAINSYRNTNAEASIQIEAQVASNTIGDIIISATDCQFIETAVSGTPSKLLAVRNGNNCCIVMLDENASKLRLKKVDIDDAVLDEVSGKIDAKATAEKFFMAGNDKMLLADYATDMDIFDIDTPLVQVKLSFAFDGKSYTGNYMINRRNN